MRAGKNKDGKKLLSLAIRLMLLLVIPFVLGCFVFPHEFYAAGVPTGPQGPGMQAYSFSADSHRMLMEQSMGSVFPLYKYIDYVPFASKDMIEICVAGNGSEIALQNGMRLKPEQEWEIGNDGIGNSAGALACADVPATAESGLVRGGPGASNTTITLTFASKMFPRYEVEYGILQGLVMIPVFYLLVYYPATEIWKKLHRGMHA